MKLALSPCSEVVPLSPEVLDRDADVESEGVASSGETSVVEEFARLIDMVKLLRSPGGCPLNMALDLKALSPSFLEESQEIVRAIENEDPNNLAEELGDYFYLLVMAIRICEEKNLFTTNDVLQGIMGKFRRRCTWVWGDDVAETPEQARLLWKANKLKEHE
ncbi:MAG: nucleoside triphosphate pyrophosphohydrolase [uncultured bacterium]|nr:MAG: nucleoside triphosphate pyrophosphohydrolase [uncultured bacterium]